MNAPIRTATVLALGLVAAAMPARAAEPLQLEARIALPGVSGRIDHMAVDVARKRLFVAELGNDTLGVVDLAAGKPIKRVAELAEPQGVGYAPTADIVAVASGGDGSVRFYRGEELTQAGMIALSSDADNVRIDPRTGSVVVGYGSGGLAVIDPENKSMVAKIRLAAHPEAFAIAAETGRVFVNLPDAGQIAVVDFATGKQTRSWSASGLRGNFPMALDAAGTTLATVFRDPPKLVLIDTRTGAAVLRLDTCGDADDVFFDTKHRRIYVSCGTGAVDVFEADASGSYRRLARVQTASGARTSLFVPQFDRFYVAARAGSFGAEAAIFVFRPSP